MTESWSPSLSVSTREGRNYGPSTATVTGNSQLTTSPQLLSLTIRAIQETLQEPLCYFDGTRKATSMFSRPFDGLDKLFFSILISKLSRRTAYIPAEEEITPSEYRIRHEDCVSDWNHICSLAMEAYEPSSLYCHLKLLIALKSKAEDASLSSLEEKGSSNAAFVYKSAMKLAHGMDDAEKNILMPEVVRCLSRLVDDSGYVPAMVSLADMLSRGSGTQKDIRRAKGLYTRALQEGNKNSDFRIQAMHELGFLLEKGGNDDHNLSEAVSLYLRAIVEGSYVPSMLNLGFLAARGCDAFPKDVHLATQFFQLAIDVSQSKFAMHELAFLLEKGGDGLRQDVPCAAELYSKAIEQGGMSISMNNLAMLLVRGGDGLERDVNRAVELYSRAIEQDENVFAMSNLGDLLGQDESCILRAKELYEKAIEVGRSSYAMYQLGCLLQKGGGGLERDLKRAADLYSTAIAEDKHVESMTSLGLLFHKGGDGIDVDLGRAVQLYLQAIETGSDERAVSCLAELVQDGGDEIEAYAVRAREILYKFIRSERQRMDNGHGVANFPYVSIEHVEYLKDPGVGRGETSLSMNNVAMLLVRGGEGVLKDHPRAVELYTQAIEDVGDIFAMSNLADLLCVGGEGVRSDIEQAKALYLRAIREGKSTYALYQLRNLLRSEDGMDSEDDGLEEFIQPLLNPPREFAALDSDYDSLDDSSLSGSSDFRDSVPTFRDYRWRVSKDNERIHFTSYKSKSFFVFMCDFLLAYDDDSDTLLIMVPLSRVIVTSTYEFSMNDLLDEVSIEQVDLIARRLVQLTEISWEYSCLAHLEQSLPGAERLSKVSNLFYNKEMDFGPSSLATVTSCDVGLLNCNFSDLPYSYEFGLKTFGTTILLRRGESGIAKPEVVTGGEIIFDSGMTDYVDISIGGDHENFEDTVDEAYKEELNLSFIPQNFDFSRVRSKVYRRPEEIEKTFLELGYGEQFALALRRTATTHMSGISLTPERVQHRLLKAWNNISHKTLIPLTFNIPKRRVLPRETPFLVSVNHKMHLAKSKKNIQWNVTVGLNSELLTATASRTATLKEFLETGLVDNLLDTAEQLCGHRSEFEKFRGQGDWFKPDERGMSKMLGALTFLSIMLKGKVQATGEFKGCVPFMNPEEPVLQAVQFNIPVPYGIGYSTFAAGKESDSNRKIEVGPAVYRLDGPRWDDCTNYVHPAVLAGPKHADCVHRALYSCRRRCAPEQHPMEPENHVSFLTRCSRSFGAMVRR